MGDGPWREFLIGSLIAALAGRIALEGGRVGGRIPADAETRRVMANALPWALVLALWLAVPGWVAFGEWPRPDWAGALGAALALAFLWLGWSAHRALGANFARVLRIREGHTLVTTGPYSRVRHPVYAAGLLFILAAPLLAANWLFAAAAIPGVFAVNARMVREDKMLEGAFGEEWRVWAARTGRVLPRWRGQPREGV